jgi:hypothetical protein
MDGSSSANKITIITIVVNNSTKVKPFFLIMSSGLPIVVYSLSFSKNKVPED